MRIDITKNNNPNRRFNFFNHEINNKGTVIQTISVFICCYVVLLFSVERTYSITEKILFTVCCLSHFF